MTRNKRRHSRWFAPQWHRRRGGGGRPNSGGHDGTPCFPDERLALLVALVITFISIFIMALVLVVAVPAEANNAQQYVGRHIVKEYEDSGFHHGIVQSFKLVQHDDAPASVAEGTLFTIKYDDGDAADYNLSQLLLYLIPDSPSNDYTTMSRGVWIKNKKQYGLIGDALRGGTFLHRIQLFLLELLILQAGLPRFPLKHFRTNSGM